MASPPARRVVRAVLPVVLSVPLAAPAQPGAVTQPIGSAQADELARLIAEVRDATDAGAASKAFARACNIDRRNVPLHETYVRCLLKLGRPQMGLYAAQALSKLSPENGLAWGVVAYCHARRRRLPEALPAAVQAAALAPDNAGIGNNAGYLLAWKECDKPQLKLGREVAQLISRHRGEWKRYKAFSAAYDKVKAAYDARDKRVEGIRKKIAGVESKMKPIEKRAKEIDRDLRNVSRELASRHEYLRRKHRELRGTKATRRARWDEMSSTQRRATDQTIADLERQIHDAERAIHRLQDLDRKLRKVGGPLVRQLKDQKAEIEKHQKAIELELAKTAIDFVWQPPAVDGKIVAAVTTRVPGGGEHVTTPPTPQGNEEQARARLRLAKLYLDNKQTARAKEILNWILIRHPGTQAAREAKELLTSLVAPKKDQTQEDEKE